MFVVVLEMGVLLYEGRIVFAQYSIKTGIFRISLKDHCNITSFSMSSQCHLKKKYIKQPSLCDGIGIKKLKDLEVLDFVFCPIFWVVPNIATTPHILPENLHLSSGLLKSQNPRSVVQS